MLSAVLAGLALAAAVALAPVPADRLAARPRAGPPAPAPGTSTGRSGRVGPALLAAAAAGLVVALALGGTVGAVAAVLVAAGVGRAVARRPASGGEGVPPDVLELVAACLEAGSSAGRAARVVAEATARADLRRVADALDAGLPAAQAWTALGPVGAVAARSADSGAPLARALRVSAAEVRRVSAADAVARAQRAAVLAVLPLGLCALPAFVLLGVVPVVVGLLRDVLGPAL